VSASYDEPPPDPASADLEPPTDLDVVLRELRGPSDRAGDNGWGSVPQVTDRDLADDDFWQAAGDADFWRERKTLAHVHAFALARRAAPYAVLGVVLARIITSVKPFVVLPPLVGGDASLNLFVALVGRSGAGKGAAEAAATDAFLLPDPVTVVQPGSGEGIAHAYMHRVTGGDLRQHSDAVLFTVPEVDTLTALSTRQGATLMPQLRQAYMGERLGFGYADSAKRLPVPAHKYRMCMVVGVQPERAGPLLDDSDAGTPQRFVWLPAVDRAAPDTAPRCPDPIEWQRPQFPRADYHRSVLPICDAARATIDAARLARLRGDGDALDGHALLARLKIAAALGLLDGHAEVDDDDWRLAGHLLAVSDAARAEVAETLRLAKRAANRGRAESEAERTIIVAERVTEDAAKRVARGIRKRLRADGRTARSKLRKATSARDRHLFDAAVDNLIAAGQIQEVHTDRDERGHGGDGIAYELAEGAA
jgi:hypothetical protein